MAESTGSTINMSAPTDDLSSQRTDELERRAKAQSQRGEMEPMSGRAIEPRHLDQMLSIRLSPDLAGSLRSIAKERSTTLSAVIREAALLYVATQASNTVVSWEVRRGNRAEAHQGMQIWSERHPSHGSVREVAG